MSPNTHFTVEDRILQVLQHLGIEKAHFAGRMSQDWTGLVSNHQEVISSLTLVCPRPIPSSELQKLASRLMVINGDIGGQAQGVRQSLTNLPEAKTVVLDEYANAGWADVFAERPEDVIPQFLEFLSQTELEQAISPSEEREGQVYDVSFRIQGTGPPLVLLPLGLAASQWEPVVEQLSERFCTIILAGAHLGMVPNLELRRTGLFGRLRRSFVEELELRPGERILDVGCGSGVHDRWIAKHTAGANPLTAVDVNPYLLGEARILAENEGLGSGIDFREGNAEALPFPDNSFDVTMSITVIEEVNADRMMAEMVRVTKPGGRVGVLSRSEDLPLIVNLPLPPELKAKVERPGTGSGGVSEHGCADASLYRRFKEAGLSNIKKIPQLGTSYEPDQLRYAQGNIVATLTPEEVLQWRSAVEQAEAEGTFFIARHYHCAVGTKS